MRNVARTIMANAMARMRGWTIIRNVRILQLNDFDLGKVPRGGFWILDFRFWIRESTFLESKIQNRFTSCASSPGRSGGGSTVVQPSRARRGPASSAEGP